MRRVVVVVVLFGLASGAHADRRRETPFDRGRFGVSVAAGSQTVDGNRYVVVGAGLAYYLLDGVEVEFAGAVYIGNGPSISVISPGLRYVAQPLVGVWPVVPYGGVFYQRWFYDNDQYVDSAIGARAGVIYLSGRILVELGIAYAHAVPDCARNCDSVYPELAVGMTF